MEDTFTLPQSKSIKKEKQLLTSERERKIAAIVFLGPFTVLFFIFVVLPVFYSIYLSFANYNMIESPTLIGLQNYIYLFVQDDVFMIALKNTVMFACFIGPLGYVVQFALAWIINTLPFKRFFTVAFYLPSLVGGTMYFIWLYIFSNDRYGFINNALYNLGVISSPILWTAAPSTLYFVVILVSVWQSMGTGFLVIIAGLQNVPAEIYESGRIDGISNKVQELIYITLPMMKPQLLFAAINSIVGSFAVFDVTRVIAGFPSPNYIGHTLVGHLFDHAFLRAEMGYASAISVVLFTITFVLGRVVMRVFRSNY